MTTAIVNIGQLVTLAGPARPRIGAELRELGLIPDAALLIEEGRITATGSCAEIKSQIPPHAVVVDAGGRCVTPGFVDAHTHLCFAGNRAAEFEQRIAGATYQEIAAAGGGILRTVALTRAATEDDCWPPRANIATGCCAPAPRPSKPNPATASIAPPSCACCRSSRASTPKAPPGSCRRSSPRTPFRPSSRRAAPTTFAGLRTSLSRRSRRAASRPLLRRLLRRPRLHRRRNPPRPHCSQTTRFGPAPPR